MRRNVFASNLLRACACVFAGYPYVNTLADTGDHDVSGDEAFIADAAQRNMAEIELSRVAARSADSDSVRQFATTMLQEHTANEAALASIAEHEHLPMPIAPDSDHMQLRDKLIALHGKEFDDTYMEAMRSDHSKMADFLVGAQTMVATDELRSFINKTLPVVQRHLRMAQALKS